MFDEYKKIRNKIRKYDPLNIVSKAIGILNSPDITQTKKYQFYPPWLLMLLIEWAILEKDNEQYKTKHLGIKDFNALVNMVKSFDSKQQLPSCEGAVFLMVRKMAFQQFWWQKGLNKSSFGRQIDLLITLPETPYFAETFLDLTKLDIKTYIKLTIALVSSFFSNQKLQYITKTPFKSFHNHISKDKLDSFFKLVSFTPYEAKNFLQKNDWANSSLQQQLFLETPFQTAPLLNLEGKFFPYSRALLYHSAQNLVYDLLRANNSYVFAQHFSKVFQKYVERSLQYASLNYKTEDDIKSITRSSGKVVDFLVMDNNINVFVEAKAVEMPTLGKASHEINIIADKIKTHIVKAIDQALNTANDLNKNDYGIDVSNPKKNFLLITTYKDMYIGSGRDFYNYIAKDRIDYILNKYRDHSLLIPIDNIYTISAEELDIIVTHINEGKTTIRKLLETAVANDSQMNGSKFLLSQHLPSAVSGEEIPDYLKKANDLAFDDAIANLES